MPENDIIHDLEHTLKMITGSNFVCAPMPASLALTIERALLEIRKHRDFFWANKSSEQSLQGLQGSLERSLKREERLKERIDGLQTDLIKMKDMRDKILEERPLELLPGWTLPEVLCKCGNKVHPEAVHDTGGWELCWPEECDECNLPVTPGEDIQWPFKAERAWAKDFERLGFDIE